ncbi:MAG: integration host factor subunit alpha [Acidobacteria bacterium]|nr:MAG: integration host factor subunit alpha [Acidobacteriota bacterium]
MRRTGAPKAVTKEGFMIKAHLAQIVHETHGGMSQKDAKHLVETIIDLVKDRLTQGEAVKLSGFGSLRVMHRRSRVGRNPRDGSRIQLAPSKYVVFKPSRTIHF